ncbi:MAG: insulinase family protein [Bacteroidota bacterium]
MITLLKRTATIGIVVGCFWSAGAQTIPADPAMRTGKLANGFTYYIRNNGEPQKRVLMYLVNKVGSVLEDDDQQGLAHFMEHMNFNGTRHYPKNQLVDYLQKAGIRFGADLNAYTSFDETVYELPIPTDDPTMTASGIKIMRDWAQDATLDPAEIEKERGVILEEERLGKGASDRMARKFYPMMLNHSRYADRLPIGTDNVLINFKPDAIKRFHADWYRPNLQALIVVGDVNVDETEKMIRQQFSDLKNPAIERPRTVYNIPLTGQKQFLIVTDKEKPSTEIEVLYKHKKHALITQADYLEAIKRALLTQLFAGRRYGEVSQINSPAFNNMGLNVQSLLGELDALAFDVTPKPGQLQQGFEQAWQILEKVKRYGFTQTELGRAKENYLRSLEKGFKEQGKSPSINYVKEYQELFLHGEAAPGIAWEYDFVKKHLNEVTLTDITTVMNEYLQSKDIDILVLAPESAKDNLPDEAIINGWINTISKGAMAAYKDDVLSQPLLAIKPKAGKVVSKAYIPQINTTTLTLSNGVKVVLKPTDFKNDEIRFTAFSPGGTSLYNDKDYDNAANAAPLISRFGLGSFNPVQLSKALNGKALNVAASINLRSENINGNTSVADLETALQLVYMQFTQPRKDTVLFNTIINAAKDALANRYAEPNNVFADTIARVMGNYNFRNTPSTVERLNNISLQKAYDIYKDRFADASGFTFTFVGNFEIAAITPLLEQYLGSLPSLHRNEQARDLGIHIPPGIITKKVLKGSEDKALVRLVISGDYEFSQVNNLLLNALGSTLQIKLLQHLREEESEVYSPSVQASYNKQPKARFAIIITFGCAPKNVDHLINMVEIEMAGLRENGAEADDIQKYKASYQKSLELALKDNATWLAYLSGQYENQEPLLQILNSAASLEKINTASLKAAANVFLNGGNMISFELLPETANK